MGYRDTLTGHISWHQAKMERDTLHLYGTNPSLPEVLVVPEALESSSSQLVLLDPFGVQRTLSQGSFPKTIRKHVYLHYDS